MYDWETATARLAAQAPWWEPGTASGYHAHNQGHLVGEVVRRITGKTLKQFVAEEIAGPLGADFQIGAAEADWGRIAPVVPPPPLPFDLGALDPDSPVVQDVHRAGGRRRRRPTRRAGGAPTSARSTGTATPARWRGSCRRWRSAARSTGSGCSRPETIDLIFDEQSHGVDLVLGVPLRFGIGYGLPEPETVPYVPAGADLLLGRLGRLDDHHATSTAG